MPYTKSNSVPIGSRVLKREAKGLHAVAAMHGINLAELLRQGVNAYLEKKNVTAHDEPFRITQLTTE